MVIKKFLQLGHFLNFCGLRITNPKIISESETKELITRILGIDREGVYLVYGFDGIGNMVKDVNAQKIITSSATAKNNIMKCSDFETIDLTEFVAALI